MQTLGKGKEVRVKIISHIGFSGDSTEERINKWFSEHPNVNVIDIRYTETWNNDSIDYVGIIIYSE